MVDHRTVNEVNEGRNLGSTEEIGVLPMTCPQAASREKTCRRGAHWWTRPRCAIRSPTKLRTKIISTPSAIAAEHRQNSLIQAARSLTSCQYAVSIPYHWTGPEVQGPGTVAFWCPVESIIEVPAFQPTLHTSMTSRDVPERMAICQSGVP